MKYFQDPLNPSMNELINWFQIVETDLANSMKMSFHNAVPDEPNPYHIEDSIWTHTMMVCLRAEDSNKIVKICSLLHDIGKPKARGIIPYEMKKPVLSESNQLRNDGKDGGEHSGLDRIMPKSGVKSHFRGHEGISTHLAVSVLNKLRKEDVISYGEMCNILTIISLHGTLFDNIRDGKEHNPADVIEKFKSIDLYRDFVQQVRNDSTGRFFTSKDGRKNSAFDLGHSIYNEDTFYLHYKPLKCFSRSAPVIKVLTGLPCSGKSTYISNVCDVKDVIISRDDLLLRYGREKFGPGKTYSEVWKLLTDNDMQKDVDGLLEKRFKDAVKARKNIIIDMTNTSKKSRRKWIGNVPKEYYKESVVFFCDLEILKMRNAQRYKDTGKSIPDDVFDFMSKQFMVPTYEEFDSVQFELN